MEKNANNWYVITGAPNSGKTTILKRLEKRGFKVVYEAARLYIDEQLAQGLSLQEIRKDEYEFQKKILQFKIDVEKNLDPKETIFFDRGIPDTIAYLKLIKMRIADDVIEPSKKSSYKKIFLFKHLPYKLDYARTENKEQAHELEKLLCNTYKQLHFPIAKVPLVSVHKRLQIVLDEL